MMGSVVALDEALGSKPHEQTRTRVTASAFERLEERGPQPPDLVIRRLIFAQVGAMAALVQLL